MPIIGLTDKRVPKIERIGKLRKGDKKEVRKKHNGDEYEISGKELPYFRFTPEEGNPKAAEFVELFEAAYGKEPKEVEVFLPFRETDKNFETWYEEHRYNALQHRCDGVNTVLVLKAGVYSTVPEPCPYRHMENDKDRPCKIKGKLNVIIPALGQLAIVQMETGGNHDIRNIHGALVAYEQANGGLTGIPFILYRKEESVSRPSNGKRTRVTKHNVRIRPKDNLLAKMLEAEAKSKPQIDMQTGEVLGLPEPEIEIMYDDEEIEGLEPEWTPSESTVNNYNALSQKAAAFNPLPIGSIFTKDEMIVEVNRLKGLLNNVTLTSNGLLNNNNEAAPQEEFESFVKTNNIPSSRAKAILEKNGSDFVKALSELQGV